MTNQSLENVKAGDTLVLSKSGSSNSSKQLVKVERVTKTAIFVQGLRFRVIDGWQAGTNNYTYLRIAIPTAGDLEEIEQNKRHFMEVQIFGKLQQAMKPIYNQAIQIPNPKVFTPKELRIINNALQQIIDERNNMDKNK